AVGVGVDRDAGDPGVAAGADDPDRDLPSVGDENLAQARHGQPPGVAWPRGTCAPARWLSGSLRTDRARRVWRGRRRGPAPAAPPGGGACHPLLPPPPRPPSPPPRTASPETRDSRATVVRGAISRARFGAEAASAPVPKRPTSSAASAGSGERRSGSRSGAW